MIFVYICMHTNVSSVQENTNTSINIIHGLRMQVHIVEDQDHLQKRVNVEGASTY